MGRRVRASGVADVSPMLLCDACGCVREISPFARTFVRLVSALRLFVSDVCMDKSDVSVISEIGSTDCHVAIFAV